MLLENNGAEVCASTVMLEERELQHSPAGPLPLAPVPLKQLCQPTLPDNPQILPVIPSPSPSPSENRKVAA